MHEEGEIPQYERIFDGSVMEQVKISKLFNKNLKIIEAIRRKKQVKNTQHGNPLGTR